jgi:hypothetical protein
MKNWKQNVFFGMVAIIVFVFGFIGCKSDPDPEPQELPIVVNGTGGNSVTIMIKYIALPNTTPSYISKIQQAASWLDENNDFGNRTGTIYINVISSNAGFVKNGTRTLDVGSGWLSNSNVDAVKIYDDLTVSGAFVNDWFTMIKAVKLAMLV